MRERSGGSERKRSVASVGCATSGDQWSCWEEKGRRENPGRKRDQSEDVKEREAGRKRNAIKDGGGEREEE